MKLMVQPTVLGGKFRDSECYLCGPGVRAAALSTSPPVPFGIPPPGCSSASQKMGHAPVRWEWPF